MKEELIQKLREASRRIVLENQDRSGAYVASPSFSQYGYSWLRDGGFIAYSMLKTGEEGSAQSFIQWGAGVLDRYRDRVDRLPKLLVSGKYGNRDFLAARYKLDGSEDTTDWPNFQIDGYGTWLWLVAEFCAHKGLEQVPEAWLPAVRTASRYLEMVWKLPNSDCWEENADKVHPATLACVAGGLKAVSPYLRDADLVEANRRVAGQIRDFILDSLLPDGRIPKYLGSDSVDSSLLWVSLPFEVLEADHPAVRVTLEEIEKRLLEKGGVKRYPQDTYYGGGQWILLSAWLAWYYVRVGRVGEAEAIRDWILTQMKDDGSLPEQISAVVNEPSMVEPWEKRWGTSACPLLWSHGMFLILDQELKSYAKGA